MMCDLSVRKIKTPDGWYLYDPGTNRILRVPAAVYDLVDVYHSTSAEQAIQQLAGKHATLELEKAHALITRVVQQWGALAHFGLKKNVPYTTEANVSEGMQDGVTQCTLEVTQACNLRCRYCIYSGGYTHQRTHGVSRMAWTTAKAAVDLFAARNQRYLGDFVTLGFYGGEPLLEFRLIRDIMEYAKSIPVLASHDLCFALTTNATLLTEEMVPYFERNNVSLLVSLDGPKEMHDHNRVYPDGSGSYGRVLRNIHLLRKLAPDYFMKRVHFSATIAPDADLLRLRQFFEDGDMFSQHRIRVNSISPGNSVYCQQNPPYSRRNTDYDALLREFIDRRVMMQNPSNLAVAMCEEPFVLLHKRPIYRGPVELNTTSKACFPGGRKIYVACDGTVHICEKMNPCFPIGHVQTGLDAKRITDTINSFAQLMNEPDCLRCWAFRLCNVCFATVDGAGRFLEEAKKELCPSNLAQAKQTLSAYCWAQERNPRVWDYLDAYTLA